VQAEQIREIERARLRALISADGSAVIRYRARLAVVF
jgi:hypothetical protein